MGELAAKIRAKYPGAYDSLPDADLESKIIAKFPGVYDHLAGPTQSANYTEDPAKIERARREFVRKDKANIGMGERVKLAAGDAWDYINTPNEESVLDAPQRVIPKSLANTVGAFINPSSAYSGLSKEAIDASFPGGNPTQKAKEELKLQDLSMAKGIVAPFGVAGGDAFVESWTKNPVGSVLTVAPTVPPTVNTLRSLGRKVTTPIKASGIPGTERYYKTEAGQRLRDVLVDERGQAGIGIDEQQMKPADSMSIPKPRAAVAAESSKTAEAAGLKKKYGVKPTLAQESGNIRAAMLEQSLAAKNPDLAEALKYNDAAINQAGVKGVLSSLGEGRPLPYAEPAQNVGSKIIKTIESARAPEKAKVSAMYKDIPDFQVGTDSLLSAVQQVKSASLPKDQKAKLLNLTDYIESEIGDSTSMGFQNLHAIRKTLGSVINDATKGINPDRTTAKFAMGLKSTIDGIIDQTPQLPDIYKSAKNAYQDYANKFSTGDVAEILQRGNEITGLKIPEEKIAQRFFTPTGADSLIRAVGADKAKSAMKQHAIADLISKTTDNDGNMNINRSLAWVRKNAGALHKLGLTEEMRGLIRDQVPRAISRTIESKRLDVLNNPMMTVNETRRLLAEYRPALKELYKDNPEALTALEDYHKLVQMLARNKNVSYSGGSNTIEKAAMSDFFSNAAKTGLNKWASRLTRGLWDVVSGYGDKQINAILKDAVLNPETAKSLMELAENANNLKAAKKIDLRLSQMGLSKLQDKRGVVGEDINNSKKGSQP